MAILEISPEDLDDDYVEHLLVSQCGRSVRNRSSLTLLPSRATIVPR